MQVLERGTLTFNSSGVKTGGAAGRWILHHTYDGLGRLIMSQKPWDEDRLIVHVENYFYDGVRRIQEVVSAPIPGSSPKEISDPEMVLYSNRTEREYVWSAAADAAGGAGVDELICQITGPANGSGPEGGGGGVGTAMPNNHPVWSITDPATRTTLALIDRSSSDTPRVIAQYAWSPYGELIVGDYPTAFTDPLPEFRVGHQGLFADRLDTVAYYNAQALEPNAPTLYHNRNRTYSPSLGRFIQQDPNASGLPVIAAEGAMGNPRTHRLGDFDIMSLYSRGMHLYAYCSLNGITRVDPLGLSDFSIVSLLGASTTTQEMQQEWTSDVVDAGMQMRGGLSGLLDNYGYFQQDDTYWALNWNRSDEGSSHSVSRQSARANAGAGRMHAGVFHHLATNKYLKGKNQWTKKFKVLFDKAGLSMNDKANLLEMSDAIHRGRHAEKYHAKVYDRLFIATQGKAGDAAKDALMRELDSIKEWLRRVPDAINGNF